MQERKVVKNIPISNNFVKTIILSSEGLVLVNEQKTVGYQIQILRRYAFLLLNISYNFHKDLYLVTSLKKCIMIKKSSQDDPFNAQFQQIFITKRQPDIDHLDCCLGYHFDVFRICKTLLLHCSLCIYKIMLTYCYHQKCTRICKNELDIFTYNKWIRCKNGNEYTPYLLLQRKSNTNNIS